MCRIIRYSEQVSCGERPKRKSFARAKSLTCLFRLINERLFRLPPQHTAQLMPCRLRPITSPRETKLNVAAVQRGDGTLLADEASARAGISPVSGDS